MSDFPQSDLDKHIEEMKQAAADVTAAFRPVQDQINAMLHKAWLLGHAAGRDYQGDGWNSDGHDPAQDSPYRASVDENVKYLHNQECAL